MSWDFETPQRLQNELDWIDQFVRENVEPLDYLVHDPLDLNDAQRNQLIKPLQQQVKQKNLWGLHLGKALGGPGRGQLELTLINEILGRSLNAPTVFGCQAPDAGNAEILAHYGTSEQKKQYLEPLLANEIASCFAMTEPQGGADPKMISTSAVLDAGHWTLNGSKWFATNARFATFYITLANTDPDASNPYQRQSVFIVPADTPGIEFVRHCGVANEPGLPSHSYLEFSNVRIPEDHLLGERGRGFVVTQVRLGGGRIHHAMRSLAQCQMAFDMMCERALSRVTQGEILAEKQMVQDMIAESWMAIEQYRLLLLQTAWKADKFGDYQKIRKDIAAVKTLMPRVLQQVAANALQIHGSLGITNEMPFANQIITAYRMGIADGPTEVQKITLAKQILKEYQPSDDLFPRAHGVKRAAAAHAMVAEL
ncbi:MAG: acyl-CoA dehydrogenase family protein [Pseudomonadota bacterium]